MPRVYRRLEDKLEGPVPVLGMGATVHVDRYVIPATVVHVGTTDKRAPMVAVQIDQQATDGFLKDEEGEVLVFTWRKSGSWRQYGHGFKTGPWLELTVRRSRSVTVHDADAESTDAVDADTATEDAVVIAVDAVESPSEKLKNFLRQDF